MIAVNIAGQRLQMRAAAVIVHDGHVLLHRHEDQHLWPLPGGRVEPGEDAASTVVRAMQEEPVESGELLYLAENFFMRAGVEAGKQLELRWYPQAALCDADLYPPVLREALSRDAQHFPHAMQRG